MLIGIADGPFAAEQAARRGIIVPPGGSAEFLGALPIATLDQPELVNLLKRLGIRTLGDFAALPAADVVVRFGPVGGWAHRQAGGLDSRPIAGRSPRPEFEVDIPLEPPLDRVDSIAFSARGAIERFVLALADHGLACSCFELLAQTDRGEETVRRWRHAGVLTAIDVTDRVRWQLEGWLNRTGGLNAPTGPVQLLRLTPIETVPTSANQGALWGGDGMVDERAHRALARVQTLLGPGSVQTPMVSGGRGPAQRTRWVPWGISARIRTATPRRLGRAGCRHRRPRCCSARPVRSSCSDRFGQPVRVTERGAVTADPALFAPSRSAETRATGSDHRLGRALAGGRALVGSGRGPAAGPDATGRCGRPRLPGVLRPRPTSAGCWKGSTTRALTFLLASERRKKVRLAGRSASRRTK